MTTQEAKKVIANAIEKAGLPPHKLTAKTVFFSDLARTSRVFITVHGWKPSPLADTIKASAPAGYIVSFS